MRYGNTAKFLKPLTTNFRPSDRLPVRALIIYNNLTSESSKEFLKCHFLNLLKTAGVCIFTSPPKWAVQGVGGGNEEKKKKGEREREREGGKGRGWGEKGTSFAGFGWSRKLNAYLAENKLWYFSPHREREKREGRKGEEGSKRKRGINFWSPSFGWYRNLSQIFLRKIYHIFKAPKHSIIQLKSKNFFVVSASCVTLKNT